jgi:hypothetical protein
MVTYSLQNPPQKKNDKQKQSGTPVTDMTGNEQTKTQTWGCNAVKWTHIKLSGYFSRQLLMAIKLAAQQSDGSGIVIVEADSPFNDKWMAEKEEHLARCITPK